APLRSALLDRPRRIAARDLDLHPPHCAYQFAQSQWRASLPEMLQAVGKVAHRARVRVLVDEVYLEMLFGKPAPFCFPIGNAIAGVSENPFIVTSSLTKVYGLSGLRCGWILAAPELARRMWLLNDLFAATGAHPAERLSLMAFDHLEQFRERARALLTANRTLLEMPRDFRIGIGGDTATLAGGLERVGAALDAFAKQ